MWCLQLCRLARKYRFLVHPQWLADLRASLLRGDPSAAADLRSYSSIAGCLCAFVQSGTMEILDPRVREHVRDPKKQKSLDLMYMGYSAGGFGARCQWWEGCGLLPPSEQACSCQVVSCERAFPAVNRSRVVRLLACSEPNISSDALWHAAAITPPPPLLHSARCEKV